jgi:hypothetical protein
LKPLDFDKLADALIGGAKRYIDAALEPFVRRLAEVEQRPAAPSAEDVRRMIDEAVAKAVSELPPPKDGEDGKSVTIEDVRPLIQEEAQKSAQPLREAVEALSARVTPEALAKAASEAAVGEERIAEMVGQAVAGIELPKPPAGYAKALIDRNGHLVLTRTDGATEDVGEVVGRDADMDALKAEIERMVSEIPRPSDGEDGVGFDDMEFALAEDERTLVITAEKGERKREWSFRLSHILDRGVWQRDRPGGYLKGDGVTWGGSFWIATEDTSEKPDSGKGWRLAVKKGRDAREPAKVT